MKNVIEAAGTYFIVEVKAYLMGSYIFINKCVSHDCQIDKKRSSFCQSAVLECGPFNRSMTPATAISSGLGAVLNTPSVDSTVTRFIGVKVLFNQSL